MTYLIEEQTLVEVGPDHPAWNGLDDDGWNGGAMGQWLPKLAGCQVSLTPPPNWSAPDVERMRSCIAQYAANVLVKME